MKLDMLLLADAATVTPDGKLFIHGGGITRIDATALPWTQPQLFIAARLLVEDDDYQRSHRLELAVTSPSGARLVPPAPLEVPRPPMPPEDSMGEERFMQMALGLASLTFSERGPYRFELWVNGELLRSLPLMVEGPEPGDTAPDVSGGAQASA